MSKIEKKFENITELWVRGNLAVAEQMLDQLLESIELDRAKNSAFNLVHRQCKISRKRPENIWKILRIILALCKKLQLVFSRNRSKKP
ncbi:MAG: hypothetical protein HXX20_21705 [Chloroflexi bacterium]|nr:hypothetical protein [Chloroflexota bacterium]